MGTYDCVQAKIGAGIISKHNARIIQNYYERYYKTHKAQPNITDDIHDIAMQDSLRQWTREINDKRYQVIQQVKAQKAIMQAITTGFTTHDIGMGKGKLMQRVLSLIESVDGYEQFADFRNVVQKEHYLRQHIQAMMYDTLIEFNKFDLKNTQPAKMNDIVALLLGDPKATQHAGAKANAHAIRQVLDFLHTQYKKAGGITGKLDHYVPQSHSQTKIKEAGVEQWIHAILPRLDLAKMIDYDTGKAFTADTIRPLLQDVYDGIITKGWNNREINSALQGRSMGNKHKDPRILHFKDAQSYIEYNTQFGEKPAFVEIISYMTYMTRDIAVMQTLGPNPNATLRFIKNLISHEVNVNPHKHDLSQTFKGGHSVESIFNRFESLFDTVMGRTNQVNDTVWGKRLASIGSATRSLAATAKLGSATLASMTDVVTAHLVADLGGLPAMRHGIELLKHINPANKEHRKLAAQAGVLLDGLMFDKAIAGRLGDDPLLSSLPGKMETNLYKITGLTAWTNANRSALQMTMYMNLAQNIHKSFNDLNPLFKKRLSLYSITDADWKMLQKHYAHKQDVLLISPKHVKQDMGHDELAEKIFAWSDTEARKGVISGSHRVRSSVVKHQRGTVLGEMERQFMQVKTFPFEMIMRWVLRLKKDTQFTKDHKLLGKFHTPAKFFIGLGIVGYFVVQLKNLANGRDIEPLDERVFIKSYLQSGGAGFFGDVIHNYINSVQYGSYNGKNLFLDGLGIGGMSLGMVGQGMHAIGKDVMHSFNDNTVSVKNTTQFTTDWHPFGNVFYLKPFMNALHYQLNDMADPKFKKNLARRYKKHKKETGQDYWWKYGDVSPERLPDLSKAVH